MSKFDLMILKYSLKNTYFGTDNNYSRLKEYIEQHEKEDPLIYAPDKKTNPWAQAKGGGGCLLM